MKKKLLMTLFMLAGVLMASHVFADARITVSKGDAALCSIIATQAEKYKDRYVRHYNKKTGTISSDLWKSAKNGLPFFSLNMGQRQSQTVQLAFVEKYSTFWYYTKKGSQVNGPYFYDFIVPERDGNKRIFVDIDLELPCSCFIKYDKPERCSATDELNIWLHNNNYDSKLDHWWKSLSLKKQWEIFKQEN